MFKLKIIYFEQMSMDIRYGWIQRKSANFHCQSSGNGNITLSFTELGNFMP